MAIMETLSKLYHKYEKYRIIRMLWGFSYESAPLFYIKARRIRELALTASRVLDVGSGNAPFKEFIRSQEYITLDVPWSGFSSLPDIYADACKMPFKDCCFDMVLCFDVLEHINQLWESALEIDRVLVQEGLILITAPVMYPNHSYPNKDYFRFSVYGLEVLFPPERYDYHIREGCTTLLLPLLTAFRSFTMEHAFLFPLGKLSSLITRPFLKTKPLPTTDQPKRYDFTSYLIFVLRKKGARAE